MLGAATSNIGYFNTSSASGRFLLVVAIIAAGAVALALVWGALWLVGLVLSIPRILEFVTTLGAVVAITGYVVNNVRAGIIGAVIFCIAGLVLLVVVTTS